MRRARTHSGIDVTTERPLTPLPFPGAKRVSGRLQELRNEEDDPISAWMLKLAEQLKKTPGGAR